MIPLLYSSHQTIFVGSGFGPLSDAVSCRCTEKLNGEYEIELTIPKETPHIDNIAVNNIIKAKPNYEDKPQIFRIYSVEKNYNDLISVKAGHITYDTSGIPILPFTASNLDTAVDYMNTNRKLLSSTPFVLNADFSASGTLTVDTPTSFRSLLGGSTTSIIGVYGGDYHYDNYAINLVKVRGVYRGVCFRYGKNIRDFQQETNSEKLYDAVLGFWKKDSTVVYGSIIQCGEGFPYDKTYLLDTSSLITTANNANATVSQIDAAVRKYILSNRMGIPDNKMKIDYADDQNVKTICLGDEVGVVYPEYGINATARCNKVVFDSLNERNESIEVGVNAEDLSDTIYSVLNR